MIRSFCFASALLILTAVISVEAQERPVGNRDLNPEIRRRALLLDISTRVIEGEHNEVWAQSLQKIAIPGNPVSIKMVGSNIVVAVQFTPFIRRGGSVLVAQGQIWINDPEKGMSYYTSIQTIPLEFNEPIYFFPLGAAPELGSSIEIIITVKRYNESVITNNEE